MNLNFITEQNIIHAKVQVIWSKKIEKICDNAYEAGLKFLEISEKELSFLLTIQDRPFLQLTESVKNLLENTSINSLYQVIFRKTLSE
jgi:hypothetical protein